MIYTNMNPPTLLMMGDEVHFSLVNPRSGQVETLDYEVQDDYLRYPGSNSRIFRYLGMSEEETISLANAAYGYDTYGGDWPSCQTGDYTALTRLVVTLFMRITGRTVDSGAFDSAAKVPYERMVAEGFKLTLDTVKTADHKITAIDIASVLSRGRIQGFSLEDISDILYKLSEMGILTYAHEPDGSEVYFVDPERKAFMEYIHACKNNLPLTVIPREHDLVPVVLKYISEAPSSVDYETLLSVFGRELELSAVLENLCERMILKCWEQGYYTRSRYRDEVAQIIAEAQI